MAKNRAKRALPPSFKDRTTKSGSKTKKKTTRKKGGVVLPKTGSIDAIFNYTGRKKKK